MISETSNQKFRSVLSWSVFGLFFNLDYQPPKRKWHSSWSCHATLRDFRRASCSSCLICTTGMAGGIHHQSSFGNDFMTMSDPLAVPN